MSLLPALLLASAATGAVPVPPEVKTALAAGDGVAAMKALNPAVSACMSAHPEGDPCIMLTTVTALLAAQITPKDAPDLIDAALPIAARWRDKDPEPEDQLLAARAGLLAQAQDVPGLLRFATRLRELRMARLGPTDLATVQAIALESSALRFYGRMADAVALLQPATKAPDPNVRALAEETLGDMTEAAGDYSGAEAHYRAALDLTVQTEGPRSEQAVALLLDVAGVLDTTGRKSEAAALYARVVTDAPEGSAVQARALFAGAKSDPLTMAPVVEKVLATYERIYGPQSGSARATRALLAGLLVAHGDLARAQPLIASIEASLAEPGTNPLAFRQLALNLATQFAARKDWPAARSWFERIMASLAGSVAPTAPEWIKAEGSFGLLALVNGDMIVARTRLSGATKRQLARLADLKTYDAAAQSELKANAPLFAFLVQADWRLAKAAKR